uniref:T cell receptor beta variable 15 n=1 Tax=Moschus moschiferus TaxID=68415 RepID=A0A8C6CQA2_MOSMO
MEPRLLHCVALCLLGAGHMGAMVVQNPRYLVTGMGKPVTLSCSQNLNHDVMYWYQQKPSQAPTLLLYYYDEQITKEKSTSENFQSSRPNTSFCSLDIRSAGLGDSAVYFCASSRDTELKPSLPSVHKPLFPRAKSPSRPASSLATMRGSGLRLSLSPL